MVTIIKKGTIKDETKKRIKEGRKRSLEIIELKTAILNFVSGAKSKKSISLA